MSCNININWDIGNKIEYTIKLASHYMYEWSVGHVAVTYANMYLYSRIYLCYVLCIYTQLKHILTIHGIFTFLSFFFLLVCQKNVFGFLLYFTLHIYT